MTVLEVFLRSLFRGQISKQLGQDIKSLLTELSGGGDDQILDERPEFLGFALIIVLVFLLICNVHGKVFLE